MEKLSPSKGAEYLSYVDPNTSGGYDELDELMSSDIEAAAVIIAEKANPENKYGKMCVDSLLYSEYIGYFETIITRIDSTDPLIDRAIKLGYKGKIPDRIQKQEQKRNINKQMTDSKREETSDNKGTGDQDLLITIQKSNPILMEYVLKENDVNTSKGYSKLEAVFTKIDPDKQKMILECCNPNTEYGSKFLIKNFTKYAGEIIIKKAKVDNNFGLECICQYIDSDNADVSNHFLCKTNPNTERGSYFLLKYIHTSSAKNNILINADPENEFGFKCLKKMSQIGNIEATDILINEADPNTEYGSQFLLENLRQMAAMGTILKKARAENQYGKACLMKLSTLGVHDAKIKLLDPNNRNDSKELLRMAKKGDQSAIEHILTKTDLLTESGCETLYELATMGNMKALNTICCYKEPSKNVYYTLIKLNNKGLLTTEGKKNLKLMESTRGTVKDVTGQPRRKCGICGAQMTIMDEYYRCPACGLELTRR